MKIEDVEIPLLELEELMGDAYTGLMESAKCTNPYKSQKMMEKVWINLYKKGFLAGFHQANGGNILKTIETKS